MVISWGLAIIAVALVLPVARTGQFLASASAADLSSLIAGVWIFKLASAALGALWIAADAFRPSGGEFDALLEGGRSDAAAPSRRWNAAALAICVLGLLLRCYDLNSGLWFDEIDTLVRYGSASMTRVVSSFETQNNHVAYSILANLSVGALGPSAWALRLPAVILGVLSLWALWRFALRVTSPAEALLATAFLAVSSHHVSFSQDARGYTGMLLASIVASAVFLELVWQRKATGLRLPVSYGLAASFGIWMHSTAVFLVAAHFAIWIWLCWRRPSARGNRAPVFWAFAFATAFSLWAYAVVLPQFVHTLSGPSMPGQETQWRNPLWMIRETGAGLAAGLPGGWLALIEGGVLLALGLWSYGQQRRALLAIFLLPAVLTATVVLAQGHNLWPRFFFFSAGFAVLILLRGISEFVGLCARGPLVGMRRGLAWAAATLLCLASAATLPRTYGPKQDFEAAGAFLQQRAAAEDVATLEMANLPFLVHQGRPWTQIDDLQGLMEFERGKDKVWIVLTMPTHLAAVQPDIWKRLNSSEYRDEQVFFGTKRGGEIVVKVRVDTGRDH